jgi:hypothetical protein
MYMYRGLNTCVNILSVTVRGDGESQADVFVQSSQHLNANLLWWNCGTHNCDLGNLLSGVLGYCAFLIFFPFLVHTLSRHVQDRGVLGLSPLVHTLPRHVQDHCVLGNVFGQVCLPEMSRTAVFSVTIVCCNVPFSLVLSLSVCMPRLRFFCCEIMASPRSCPLLVWCVFYSSSSSLPSKKSASGSYSSRAAITKERNRCVQCWERKAWRGCVRLMSSLHICSSVAEGWWRNT